MSSAVGRTDGLPEEPTTDTTTDSEPAPDLAAAPSDLTTRSTRHLRDDLLEAVGRAVVGADEPLRLDPDGAPRRRPRPRRGRPGHRQDAPRPGDRPGARPPDEPDPGHAGPPAGRRHRIEPVRGRHAPVRARPGLHEHPPRRRDQPGDAADPGGAARGDAGAAGLDRGRDPPAARSVRRPRDAEPDRVRGDVRPPPGAAGPVPRPDPARLPGRGRRARRSPAATRRPPSRSTRSSRSPTARDCSRLRDEVRRVRVADEVEAYLVALVRATRAPPGPPARGEPAGDRRALPRRPGGGAPRRAASFVLPDDVKAIARPVLAHRLVVDLDRSLRGASAEARPGRDPRASSRCRRSTAP